LTYLNAHVTDLHAGIKPEIMMPTEIVAAENLFEHESRLSVGAKVRFVGKPYTGGVGKIVEILPEKVQYASGLWLDSVVVRRSDGEEIKIPTTNIEIIVE
jgi:hypothetical protein